MTVMRQIYTFYMQGDLMFAIETIDPLLAELTGLSNVYKYHCRIRPAVASALIFNQSFNQHLLGLPFQRSTLG
jgi:hypothetical protein